jgi:hypothetical protein
LIRMPSKRMSLTEAVRNTDSDVPKMKGMALMMAGNMTAMSFSADSTMPCNVQMQHVKQRSNATKTASRCVEILSASPCNLWYVVPLIRDYIL